MRTRPTLSPDGPRKRVLLYLSPAAVAILENAGPRGMSQMASSLIELGAEVRDASMDAQAAQGEEAERG